MAMLVSTVFEAWAYHSFGGIVSLIVVFGAGITIFLEVKLALHQIPQKIDKKAIFFQGISVFLGGLITYALTHSLRLGPVVAASLVAILAYLVAPDYAIPAYCGAFIGMTSNDLLFNFWEVGLGGIISGIVFILTRDVFNGFGGKLGTIALIGTAATGMSLGREFLLSPIGDWKTTGLILLTALIATPLTFYLNNQKEHGPVMASAYVGLIAGLILPNILPQYGQTLAVVAICASFAGMTNPERCSTFWHIFITAAFTGLVFVYSTPLLGGAGGKLGTIAFGSVLATYGYIKIINWLRRDQKMIRG